MPDPVRPCPTLSDPSQSRIPVPTPPQKRACHIPPEYEIDDFSFWLRVYFVVNSLFQVDFVKSLRYGLFFTIFNFFEGSIVKLRYFLVFLSFALLAAEHVPIDPADVLLLAHFNSKQSIQIGNIKGLIDNGEITGGETGFPFKDSSPQPEALDLKGSGRYFAIPAKNNIDPQRGTIQFLVKPRWATTGYRHCIFLHMVFDRTKRASFAWGSDNSFYIQKPHTGNVIQFTQNANRENSTIQTEIPYSTDTWHQITVTWDADAKSRSFYLDGELVGSSLYVRFPQDPEEICIGGLKTWNAQAYIDELRIIKVPLTPEQVKQDYEALFAGKEFPTPPQNRPADIAFKPVHPPKIQEPAALTEDVFNCPFIDTPPNMDGILDDAPWEQAFKVSQFLHKNGGQAEAETTVRIYHDSNAIHIGVTLAEPNMKDLVAKFDQDDMAIWSDDSFEMVLDTGGKKDSFYHILINPLGSKYDAIGAEKNWNATGAIIKTARNSYNWTIEFTLPFSAFKLPKPQIGEAWAVRFCRERHAGKTEYTANPRVKSGSFNQRAFLAKLNFTIASQDNALEIVPKQDTFDLGYNTIQLQCKNADPKWDQITLEMRQFDSHGKVIALQKESHKPDDIIQVNPIVEDDRVDKLIVTALVNQKVVSGCTLKRNSENTGEGGLDELEKTLEELSRNIPDWVKIDHPIHRGVVKSIWTMQDEIKLFKDKLQQAIKNKATLSKQDADHIAAQANGFRLFREDYRYLVWETSPWEVGAPNAPEDAPFNPYLEFQVAGNEREAKCIIISGLLCGKRTDLRIQPIAYDKNRRFLSNDNFEVSYEPFVNHNGSLITAPLVRIPGNIVTITPGEATRIWIVFNSKDIPPGEYETTIDIKPLHDYDIPTRKLDTMVKVWNFTLPETDQWPIDAFMWGPMCSPLDEIAMMNLMHDFHFKWTMTESHSYINGFVRDRRWLGAPPKGKRYNDDLVLNANQEFFEQALKKKMKIVFAWGSGPDARWHQMMNDRLLKIGFKQEDIIYHGLLRDEFAKRDIPNQKEARAETKAILPNAQFMATYLSTPPPAGATLEDLDNEGLTDFFKVWTVISGRFEGEQADETIKFFKDRKRTLWTYRCSQNMTTVPILPYYRFYPIQSYRKGLDGIAMWCSYSAKGDDGFDHRDGYDDGINWRGLDKKPVPTKRFHALREGLEDVAYLHELKRVMELAKDKKIDTTEYDKLIAQDIDQYISEEAQELVDTWRLEVGTAIHSLNAKLAQ